MTIQEQVKPCPFCKSSEVEVSESIFSLSAFFICIQCRANGPVKESVSKSIKAWNTRSPEPKQFSGYSTETPKGVIMEEFIENNQLLAGVLFGAVVTNLLYVINFMIR